MPVLVMVGSAGLGLVWGWLLGSLGGRVRRPLLDLLVLGAATILLAGQVFLMVNWRALALFLGVSGLAWLLHLGWRHELRTRFGPPKS